MHMLSKKIVTALNNQIQAEMYSSYLYLAMAAYCDRQNLKGFAHWMNLQADEERGHAMRFFNFLLENGEKVALKTIDQPPADFGTPLQMFRKVLEHEKKITALIHKLYQLALDEKDYRSQIMLQWFVSEQMEEEEQAQFIATRIEQVDGKMSAVLWIDKELGKRGKD
jgi:ferritin